ncbi:restriction endonuclease subunit S [Vibrio cholerae]
MEQVLYKLPDGWEWKRIEEVFTITSGKNLTKKDMADEGKFSVYGGNGIAGRYNDFNLSGSNIIIGRVGALCGNVRLVNGDIWVTDNAFFIKEYKVDILKEYLAQVLSALNLGETANKAAQPVISYKGIKDLVIPYPPLDEQKRIVEKLDALLNRIDTAIEHLQSKLDLSKQLFDSVLDEFFKLSDCDSVPLTEVVDFIGGSQPPKSQFSDVQKEGYVRLIQIRDYKTDNHIVYVDSASTKKFCTREDVMIGRYGPPVFQILRGLDGAYNVALMKAVPNEDVLTKDYLFWFLQSPSIQNYVIGISQRAAGQSGVNKKALEKYLIPVPSKTIQNDIVDKVGQLVNKSRNLEAEVTAEITSLNQLKASILDSAFKGEL